MKIIFRFGKTKLHVCWLSGVIVSERKKGLSKGSGNEECFSSVDCSSNCNGYYYLQFAHVEKIFLDLKTILSSYLLGHVNVLQSFEFFNFALYIGFNQKFVRVNYILVSILYGRERSWLNYFFHWLLILKQCIVEFLYVVLFSNFFNFFFFFQEKISSRQSLLFVGLLVCLAKYLVTNMLKVSTLDSKCVLSKKTNCFCGFMPQRIT